MFGIGMPELILILIVGLIVFGPGKLPEVGRMLGKGMREFQKASNMLSQAINEPDPLPKEKREKPKTFDRGESVDKEAVEKEKTKGEVVPATKAAKESAAGERLVSVDSSADPASKKSSLAPDYHPPTQESAQKAVEAAKMEKETKAEKNV